MTLSDFFVADDLGQLVDLIDECADPSVCDYLELPSGAIYWDKPAVAVPIEVDEGDEPKAEIPWSGADVSWSWSEAIYSIGDDEGEWVPLFTEERETPGGVVPLRPPR
ncbi:hypothetical protein [Bradyrhizobium sp. RDM4]|uniref:hypothetical protein n=1 Tax=Bradyrhizobium sp. RDM4 TaxID=3378765 RepID=UPI0038FC8A75